MSADKTILKKYLTPQEEEDQQYPSPADSIGQPQVEPVSEATTNQDAAPQRSPASVGQNPASALALSPDAIGELRKRLSEGLSGQQSNIGQIKQALMQRLGLTNQVDLSPGFEIAKASGAASNAGSSYKKPEDESQAIAETQDRLSKAQNSYTDEVQKQLKDELSNKMLGNAYQNQRLDLMRDRMDQGIYGKAVKELYSNKQLNDLIDKNNNITRTADVLFAPGQEISSSSLHDLQQTVTGALTSLGSGGGGVGERSDRYIKSLENSYQELLQKFGNMNAVPKDDPTLKHFLGLAQEGQSYIQDQLGKKIDSLTVAHTDVTSNPKFSPMWEKLVENTKANIQKPRFLQAPTNAGVAAYSEGLNKNQSVATPNVKDKMDRLKQLEMKANGG